MAKNRPQNLTEYLINLSISDWLKIINEYIKDENDREIAKLYYLDGYCQADIAEMYGYSRSCIRDRLQIILPIIARNAENILRNTK